MNIRRVFLASLSVFLVMALAANDTEDTVKAEKKKEKVKKGFTFGAVPAITYSSDLGFQYGLVVNLYHFGDGSSYPKYHHSLYLEWSRYTKGSGVNMIKYDSEYLIPGIRTSAEFSYLTEQALDFYGFNGYESAFNKALSDDNDTTHYISRMFYRMDRRMFRGKIDFQGPILEKKLRWMVGVELSSIKNDSVDVKKLNKGQDEEDKLPVDADLLFERYQRWGIIDEEQADGGTATFVKLGAIYDTRDNEPNPMKGLWTELQFFWAPSFLGNGDLAYTKLVFTHRQYFTLVPKVLSFAYRLSYQGKLTGEMPFYMLPFVYNTAPDYTRDGFGGSKTIRGVLRNRVVGDGVAFGNAEFRWKFLRGVVLKQNVYLALSTFLDAGMVVDKYEFTLDEAHRAEAEEFLPDTREGLHMGYGAGLHIAINENFIIAADFANAVKKEDSNKLGIYIGLNFLF
ncbi:MAG: BamA/TamA family outer membrane protein [Bacteroidales bacterium]|nr:BamA/TamA family outer membrane protein [Bacteroidales bacterium]